MKIMIQIKSFKFLSQNLLQVFLAFFLFSCHKTKTIKDHELTANWADMTLYVTKNTPANSPTYASRCLGYVGLTMYEAVVNSDSSYVSLVGQLDNLNTLPKPVINQTYHWPAVFNAASARILKNLYTQTSDLNKEKIDSLENYNKDIFIETTDNQTLIAQSEAFGRSIAEAIFAWSKTDGGHKGYLKNFDKTLQFPPKPGSWKPPLYGQSFSHFPLHPHWGKNRTFLKQNHQLSNPVPIQFDTTIGSAYHNQFMAVYEAEKKLTLNQKQAAIWWGDDPDLTFTPPGHSFYLATEVIKKQQPKLVQCAETYAKLGISLADAFRNCWKWKYQFFTERANTFITEHIDQRWESFWPDPPFPAFPSGHAIQAGSMATVLTAIYGENYSLTDKAHEGRPQDGLREIDFVPRQYASFWQIAHETADSRFWGGIHIKHDNDVGLEKGTEIAKNVLQLKWRK